MMENCSSPSSIEEQLELRDLWESSSEELGTLRLNWMQVASCNSKLASCEPQSTKKEAESF